jgi:putative hydrolase of the HAD superfamily
LRLLLVTNSHQETLAIKTEITGVADFFDGIYTSHDLGHAKEDQPFWQALQEAEGFDKEATLFVDDNARVLESAEEFGVGMLLHITRPDTGRPARQDDRFMAIEGVVDLLD